MAGRKPTPSVAIANPSGLGHLAWGISLVLHGAAIIGLIWNGPLIPRRSAGNGSAARCIELFDGAAVLSRDQGLKTDAVAADVDLAGSVVRATFIPPSEAFPSVVSPERQEPPKQLHVVERTSEPGAAGVPDDLRAETQVFGVQGRGRRFVYVFDRSASMEGWPLEAAKRELVASLQRLKSIHQFQVIFYNQQPLAMPLFRGRAPQMAFADEQGQRLAARFAGGIFADGGTDHMAALRMALALKPDVIFLLTDADEPRLNSADLVEIRHISRGVTINTIEFGVGEANGNNNFLRQLAAENGGQHGFVDLRRLSAGGGIRQSRSN